MVSAVIAHRCNSLEELSAIQKSPDVVGAEIDLFCGSVITGLFCGHYNSWDEVAYQLAKHQVNAHLIRLEDILCAFPHLEFVLDLKGRNPLGHLANLKGYLPQLARHKAPYYVFPGANVELYAAIRQRNPDIRLEWICDNYKSAPQVNSCQARSLPFDLNSVFMRAETFIRHPQRCAEYSHLHLGSTLLEMVDPVCRALSALKDADREKFGIQRVTFSTDFPSEVASALLGQKVFDDCLTQASLQPSYAYLAA